MSQSTEHDTAVLTHWSEPAAPARANAAPDIAPGAVIGGRYVILKIIGKGGMGWVCEARDLEVDRIVAIKFIREELAGKAPVLQRFKRELVLAQKVTHPNVVRIYDLGVDGEMRFITMEYIDGTELDRLLNQRGKLPPHEAVSIMIQVSRGLAAAHAVGIIHRDLKPANIMIDRQGRVVVMDFGIAASMEAALVPEEAVPEVSSSDRDRLTKAGSMLGTPTFMSPEQARREHADHRSDVFGVGLLLYALLSGNIPEGKGVRDTLKKRGSERIDELIDVEPSVPPALNAIVMRCLELQPGRRYQSAGELARALEDWSSGERTRAAAGQTRRRMIGASVAAAVLAAGGAYLYFHEPRPPTPQHSIKVLVSDFANNTGNHLLDGVVDPMVAIGLEGAPFITVYNHGQARRLASELSGSPTLDDKAAQLVARREGIDVVVTGSVSRDKDGYRLSVEALDGATGKVISRQSSTTNSQDKLPRLVSAVIAVIRKQLGDTTPVSTQLAAAETFTSRSIEAAREYTQGQDLQWKGKEDDALAAYRRAVEKDPDFGRAYAGMAAMLANMGRRKDAEDAYRLAMSKIDRMSDREKYRTRGGYYLMRGEYDRAAEQFQALVKQYPADTAGLGNLAYADVCRRNMPAAVEVGRRAVAIYPNNVLQSNNLGLYQMYAGDFDGAMREFRRVLAMNAGYHKAYIGLGLCQLAEGRNADALESYGQLAKIDERGASMATLARADLALFEGRFKDAFAILDDGIKADEANHHNSWAASKWITLAEARDLAGQREQAVAATARAVEVSPADDILYAAAIVYLRSGQQAKAEALESQLNSRLGPDAAVYGKLIEAEAAILRREYRPAIRLFEDAQKISDSWLGRFGLGRAYLATGAFAEADDQFEVCLRRRGEATAVFLDEEPRYHYFPQVWYYLGRAREGLGSRGAADAYRAFLTFKQKSEKDSMVEDARARLGLLKVQ